ncbi:MAG TPA: Ig-like domain-containing protein, partial [Candidatus Kapabacteria bacterium]|nr:Ig-like domain-containing protein [Candidatus Kapabacteria bacterium]
MTATVRPRLHLHLPLQLFWMAAYLICSSLLTETLGVEPREYAIEVSVEVLSSPFALKLTWEPTGASRTYTIRRRPFGSSEWSTRATLPAGSSQFVDTSVSGGAAYEYEIQLETTYRGAGGWINAYGYVLAGGNVSWPDQKGKVLLVVDATAAASLENEIGTFQRDLIGAGWNPIRRDIARASSVPEVKNLIRAEYNADPSNLQAVILLGHVPVPYSGNIAPDLHESHRGAWPADVYYAEMDGNWTDDTVNIASGDYVANDNRPGDGKFDQSQTPSTVELELGRIDFYDLPSFAGKTQVDLLRNYLKKNTEFRNRAFTAARRMLVRDNFGDLSEDAPAVDAWRHYRQLFGAGNVRSVGPGDFFWTLQNESFLWSYGCGGGGNTKADGVGTTTDFTTQSPQSVFMILHGSYFGDWNTKDNFLRGALGSQGYTLASIWSGLPHWYMHPMGLGRSIGFCTRLTQNNVSDYKSHLNYSAQQVHISLMGDPTLESFPVIPPRNLSGTASSTVNLNWAASTDSSIIGYHVYYATSAAGAYQRLTTSAVGGTSYSHSVGTGTHHYMVRAVKLERTGSGTYLNFSQGVFTSVTKSTGGTLPTVTVSAVDPDAGEGGSSGAIRFSRSPTDGNAVTVDFVVGGTAQNGIDYNQVGSSVVIPAWSAQQEIMINPSTDNEVEEEETLTIQLRPASSYNIGSPASAVVRIADLVNRPPTISTVADQTIEAGASSSNLVFLVSDPETAAGTLTVRAESSDTQIIPQSSITLSGAGANRTVRVATPAGNTGVSTIRLIVSDGVNESSSSFSVTVITPNLKPTALPQIVETWENSPVEIVLNGTDPENQPLSFAIKVSPVNGTLSGLPPNVTYTPRTNYVGTDVFSFTVNDGKTESSPAEVGLTVSARNKPPIAIPQSLEMLEDTVLRIQIRGTDPEQDPLTFEIVQQPTNGVLSNIGTNYFYLPNTNVVGSDFFTFRVLDTELVSEPAVVAIEITSTNDAPSATNLTVELDEDTSVEFRLNGLDPDGDALNYVLIRMPTNGVITGVAPDLVYRPITNFYGADELTYYVSDGVNESSS